LYAARTDPFARQAAPDALSLMVEKAATISVIRCPLTNSARSNQCTP
jgi:hypothetical protein